MVTTMTAGADLRVFWPKSGLGYKWHYVMLWYSLTLILYILQYFFKYGTCIYRLSTWHHVSTYRKHPRGQYIQVQFTWYEWWERRVPQHPGCSFVALHWTPTSGRPWTIRKPNLQGQSGTYFWVVATLNYFVFFFHLSKNGGKMKPFWLDSYF